MLKRILINREDCEVRLAYVDGEELVELHTEFTGEKSIVGNIYKGVVEDVKPGLQAAFVDIGLERNVFMHFMDVRAEALVLGEDNVSEAMAEAAKEGLPGQIQRPGRRPRQDRGALNAGQVPIAPGDELILQVVKEEINGKAPRVTANLAIPGRYLVLLPFPSQQGGVSRKIAVGEQRYRLKKILSRINREDCSFIVRTAGVEQPEEVIQSDVEYLLKLWTEIINRYRTMKGPGLIYNEHDVVGRFVRDAFPQDIDEIICDSDSDTDTVRRHLTRYAPHLVDQVVTHKNVEALFDYYDVEKQIQRALGKKVWLKSGGFIIIDECEALTAVDVNTGRYTGSRDQEKTSLKTNLEACKVIAQQLRLRDIGGIIVVDFIDMLSRDNQEAVVEEMRRQLRHDRAKITIGRIGDFGLLPITRKRVRGSLHSAVYGHCPYCDGSGHVLKHEQVLRRVKNEIRMLIADSSRRYSAIVVTANPSFARELQEKYEGYFRPLLERTNTQLIVRGDLDFHSEDFQVVPVVNPRGLPVARTHKRREEHTHPPVDTYDKVPPLVAPYEVPDDPRAPQPARGTAAQAFRPPRPDEPLSPSSIEVDFHPAVQTGGTSGSYIGNSPRMLGEDDDRRGRGRRGRRGRGRDGDRERDGGRERDRDSGRDRPQSQGGRPGPRPAQQQRRYLSDFERAALDAESEGLVLLPDEDEAAAMQQSAPVSEASIPKVTEPATWDADAPEGEDEWIEDAEEAAETAQVAALDGVSPEPVDGDDDEDEEEGEESVLDEVMPPLAGTPAEGDADGEGGRRRRRRRGSRGGRRRRRQRELQMAQPQDGSALAGESLSPVDATPAPVAREVAPAPTAAELPPPPPAHERIERPRRPPRRDASAPVPEVAQAVPTVPIAQPSSQALAAMAGEDRVPRPARPPRGGRPEAAPVAPPVAATSAPAFVLAPPRPAPVAATAPSTPAPSSPKPAGDYAVLMAKVRRQRGEMQPTSAEPKPAPPVPVIPPRASSKIVMVWPPPRPSASAPAVGSAPPPAAAAKPEPVVPPPSAPAPAVATKAAAPTRAPEQLDAFAGPSEVAVEDASESPAARRSRRQKAARSPKADPAEPKKPAARKPAAKKAAKESAPEAKPARKAAAKPAKAPKAEAKAAPKPKAAPKKAKTKA